MNHKGFHLSVSAISKTKEHSVVAKSAYNSGSKLVSKKTGVIHDYLSKSREKILNLVDSHGHKYTKVIQENLVHSALITPMIAGDIAVTREGFWNEIEQVETRKNAQLATEIDVMFPESIGANQRVSLIEAYSQTLSDRYNVLVDVCIHRPHSHEQHKDNGEVAELTSNNFHAHILLSSREILADGAGGYTLSTRKNWLQWSTSERLSKKLNGRGDELNYQRELWAELANAHLPEAQHISADSYRKQGINQLPKMKLGKSLYKDVLKGKRSVIHEYNETIDALNRYIEDHGLIIEYGDEGRIDTEVNVQSFKGVTVKYKKRKPFASINLNKLTVKSPVKTLDNASIIKNFMSLATDIALKKKTERSALLSTIDEVSETLSKQVAQFMSLKGTYEQLPDRACALGLDWEEDIKWMTQAIASAKTQQETAEIKEVMSLLTQFKQDETQQTTKNMTALESRLAAINEQVQQNEVIFNEITPKHQSMVKMFNTTQALKKTFDKQLSRADSMLERIDKFVVEKKDNKDKWHDAFHKLVAIDVTDNLQTYNKYQQLAEYDITVLNRLKREYGYLERFSAAEITDKAQQQLDTLLSALTDYKDNTETDLKVLKQQINTSVKTYERLGPLYTRRQELLDTKKSVIEQDEALYDEITSSKTTQLNAIKLNDWEQQVDVLHAQLLKARKQAAIETQLEEQRQADIKKQAREAAQKRQNELEEQAKQEREAEQVRQAQQKSQQIAAYQDRFSAFQNRISLAVRKIGFKGIDAPSMLISSAENLASATLLLDGLPRTKDLTSHVEQGLNEGQIKITTKAAQEHTDNIISQIDELPDDKRKIDVIGQLNATFNQVLDLQSNNDIIKELQVQLDGQQRRAQKNIDGANANRYSSPRP